ncbi:hypothetical protein EI94DRAFT_1701203 [Lactarius quietus]|nr:hypothetical protein EI94DRAFT_1701203 [Lactarius quietus]
MTVSRDPHPSCNDLPASIWRSTASYHVTHKLADSARLVIGEVAIVFCRYECAYGLFLFNVLLITCLPEEDNNNECYVEYTHVRRGSGGYKAHVIDREGLLVEFIVSRLQEEGHYHWVRITPVTPMETDSDQLAAKIIEESRPELLEHLTLTRDDTIRMTPGIAEWREGLIQVEWKQP